MRKFTTALLTGCIWAWMHIAVAQDANFTQFYASPLYLNPALTGATPHFRFNTIYRNQWWQVPNNYQTNQISADFNLDYYDSGIGVLLSQDRIGALAASITQLNLSYAYRVRLRWGMMLRMGIQGGIGIRNTDWGRFVFEDQLQSGGATAESFAQPTVIYPDFTAGAVLHRTNFWIGLAAFHLSRPSVGLLSNTEKLPMRFSAQAGYRIDLDPLGEGNIALSPTLLYQRQGNFNQLDLGANLYYHPLLIGIWYRGLPISSTLRGSINQDAIAGLVGVRFKNSLTVSYSYDVTLSTLNRSGGAHEISVIYEPADKRRKRGSKHVDCPIVF
ncbi:MAG: type IX secretion system membrane protein PorP/SprF [Cytophagales bacterium]|nr:type IX secretion system membrane protein PorP/SprF [Bernardetiaceae bacterium]MDW8205152.1 type IX secretion system membrane protein PorP/SprF [Cytophagales bacterium]